MPLSPTKSNVYVLFQNKDIKGEGGLLTLKSVKRTDSGEYLCKGTDFDNFDKDLSAKLNLMVHCKWSTSTRQHNRSNQASKKVWRTIYVPFVGFHPHSEPFSSWLNPWIIEVSTEWGLKKSSQPNDINFNFSQFICYFNVVQTAQLDLILSFTLSNDGRDKASLGFLIGFSLILAFNLRNKYNTRLTAAT